MMVKAVLFLIVNFVYEKAFYWQIYFCRNQGIKFAPISPIRQLMTLSNLTSTWTDKWYSIRKFFKYFSISHFTIMPMKIEHNFGFGVNLYLFDHEQLLRKRSEDWLSWLLLFLFLLSNFCQIRPLSSRFEEN